MMSEYKALNTYKEIIAVQTTNIGAIKKHTGVNFAESYVKVWITTLNEVVGVKNQMNETAIDITAMQIVSEFPLLQIHEISCIFRDIITGKFGQFYESLNPAKICAWFREWWENKLNYASGASICDSSRFKNADSLADNFMKSEDASYQKKISRMAAQISELKSRLK